MAIGTSEYLPLGITAYDCKLVRRRKVAAICALIALSAIGVAVAETAGRLAGADQQPGDARPASPPGPLLAEAPIPGESAAGPPGDLVHAPRSPAPPPSIESPSGPTPVQAAPPTVIRGAGTKPH